MVMKLIRSFYYRNLSLPKDSCIILISGGLGNQIFQYLLGVELRKVFHKKIYYYDLRKSFANYHSSNIENLFDLEINKYFLKKNTILKRILLSKNFLSINKILYFKFNFTLIPHLYIDKITEPIDLEKIGSSDSIKIFYGAWHNLINKYKNKEIFSSLKFKNDSYKEEIFNFEQDFIALHVRRGDYINSFKTAAFHGNLNSNYFFKSVRKLRSKFGNLPVFIFSDDIKWVNANMKSLIPNSFVISSKYKSPEKDFLLMSKAKYFIISNSTYSWLSAFLSTKKNKYIILPKYWFRNLETNSNYIFKEWDYEII